MIGHLSAASSGKMPSSGALTGNISLSIHSGASARRGRVLPAASFGSADVTVFGSAAAVLPFSLPNSYGEWLDEALEELSKVDNESREEGFPLCSRQAKNNAESILRNLAGITSVAPSVYPTSDEEIAIQFRVTGATSSVLLLCDSLGSGACFSYVGGKSQRARFDDALDLPNGFAKVALRRLDEIQR